MASFVSGLHVLLPLSLLCLVSLHAVAAQRKFHIKEPRAQRTLIMSSSSSPTFYNAFDSRTSPNTGAMGKETAMDKETAINNKGFKDVVDGELDTQSYSTHDDTSPFQPTPRHDGHAFPATHGFSAPTTSSNAHQSLPLSGNLPSSLDSSFHQPGYGHQSFPSYDQQGLHSSPFAQTGYGEKKQSFFSYDQQGLYRSPSSSSSAQTSHGEKQRFFSDDQQSLYRSPSSSDQTSYGTQRFPPNDEQELHNSPSSSFPQTTYGKKILPSNDQQQGLYSTPSSSSSSSSSPFASFDAKRFFYNSPSKSNSMGNASPFKEDNLFRSPSSYGTSYDFVHGGDTNNAKMSGLNELKSNEKPSSYDYKSEKPVSNYDSFFNKPTIMAGGSTTTTFQFDHPKFPMNNHDLTYGHVQVP